MRRKLIVGVLFLAVGLLLSGLLNSLLSGFVYDLYEWTSNGNFLFYGKDFFFMTSPIYYVGFGFSFFILGVKNENINVVRLIKNFLSFSLLFSVILVGYCAFDAQLKIMVCTSCTDGVRSMTYSEIGYGNQIGVSLIIASFLSIYKLIDEFRRNKR